MSFDEILFNFVATDYLRPYLRNPSKIGDFIYATNAYVFCKMPILFLTEKYLENEDFPNIEAVAKDALKNNDSIDIELDNKTLAALVAKVHKRKYCDTCRNYPNSYCTNSNHAISEIHDPNQVIVIEGVYFGAKYLQLMIDLSIMLNKPIVYYSKSKDICNMFEIGEVKIGLMPKRQDYDAYEDMFYY